jgi:CBS-domain-containing membrane protein
MNVNVGVCVSDVMDHPVVTATADTTLGRLAAILAEHDVDAVPVVDEDGRAVGMITETDVAQGFDVTEDVVTAADVMSTPVVTVQAKDDVDDALRKMRRRGVGRLPVLDTAGRVVGIISGSDLRRAQALGKHTDSVVRRGVIDRVIDAGGEVLAVTVAKGVVRLHIRIGTASEIPLLEHLLSSVPGVTRLELNAEPIDSVDVEDFLLRGKSRK